MMIYNIQKDSTEYHYIHKYWKENHVVLNYFCFVSHQMSEEWFHQKQIKTDLKKEPLQPFSFTIEASPQKKSWIF